MIYICMYIQLCPSETTNKKIIDKNAADDVTQTDVTVYDGLQ